MQNGPSTETPLVLVIDIGTHSLRVSLVDSQLTIRDQHRAPLSLRRRDRLRVEQDPVGLIEGLHTALQALKPQELAQCHGAALAIQRSSVLAWNSDTGAALSPVLSWQDCRGLEAVQRLAADAEAADEIAALSGLALSPHYGATKIRELQHAFSTGSSAAVATPLVSYILFHLLAEHSLLCDESNASRTQLYAIHQRQWSPKLCNYFNVDKKSLPLVLPTLTNYGPIAIAEKKTDIPLLACCGDQNASFVALRREATQLKNSGPWVFANLGTGAFLLSECSEHTPRGRLLKTLAWSRCNDITYLLEATVNGAAASISWLRQQEPELTSLDDAKFFKKAVAAMQEPPNCVFINAVGGLGSPIWRSDIDPVFVAIGTGAESHVATSSKIAAVFESIAFLLAINIELMAEATGKPSGVVCGGGLSKFAPLLQCVANVAQRRVYRVESPEATTRGAAISAFESIGLSKNLHSGIDASAPLPECFQPQADPPLHDRFQYFKAVLAAL